MTELQAGETMMRRVLGDEYWDRRVASTNEFNAPLRALSQSAAYGNVWSREGLAPNVRSLLCLAMLTALNRQHELEMHLVGAVNNGCSAHEIRETLLQTAIYCGIPAALDSTRVAEQFLRAKGMIT